MVAEEVPDEVEVVEEVEAGGEKAKNKHKKKKRGKNPLSSEQKIQIETNLKNAEEVEADEILEAIYTDVKSMLINEKGEDKAFKHEFWDQEPVPKMDETPVGEKESHAIEHPKLEDIRKEPLSLPPMLEWVTCNIDDEAELKEIYTLLNLNYVEDEDEMFRFDYSPEFLLWALKPPNHRQEWHVGVRKSQTKELVAFISAIPGHIRIYGKEVTVVKINFLCVHKTLRDKKMAPLLIKEITRRVNLTGIWQAIYTAGIVLPRPVASCRYYHRTINTRKLVDVGFTYTTQTKTLHRLEKLNALPESTKIPGFRPLERRDCKQCCHLLKLQVSKNKLAIVYNEADFVHWMLPRDNVISSYVVQDPATQRITDFVSFYNLSSSVLGHEKHPHVKAAYCFYYAATGHPLKDLLQDAMVMAKSQGYDVFNALDLMDNATVLEDLRFGKGDGTLQYYLYNWKCPMMTSENVGVVML
eukprot:GCRY01002769.1.p1 GENE.GCRY01002769.1~~GCRY01002769.1.p1  ORF type:complete len:506 (-),score=115.61 GCRY01002769.1:67-1473(-)